MANGFGSKRLTVGAHYGLGDWLVQRATGALIAAYTLLVLVQALAHGPLDHAKWTAVLSAPWMRGLTFVVILAVAWHAWVGIRDIWMDYVKPVGLRLLLHVASVVWLTGCVGWAVQILWRLG